MVHGLENLKATVEYRVWLSSTLSPTIVKLFLIGKVEFAEMHANALMHVVSCGVVFAKPDARVPVAE